MKLLFVVFAACAVAVLAKHGPTPMKSPLQFIPVNEDLTRIVGGETAVNNEFPWQASFQLRSGSQWYHICGGSLIQPDVVLTAAHCIAGLESYTFRVVLGDHNLFAVEGGEQVINVASYKMHESYNGNQGGFPNDIAVLYLSSPATLNDIVGLVPTASASDTFSSSDNCYISGWGNTVAGPTPNTPADELQKTPKTVMSNSQCRSSWGNSIGNYHICIFNSESSACMGDSGGPLVCEKNGNWVLAGVTSWGSSTCTLTLPNVYTRVSYYASWIAANS